MDEGLCSRASQIMQYIDNWCLKVCESLLFENRANQALASLINEVPDNGFAKIINKGDKIDADWKVIEYKDKGVSKKISLSPDVYEDGQHKIHL